MADSYAHQIGNLDTNIRATASEAYDDNIAYAKNNRKSDTITNLSLGLDAKYSGKMRSLELVGNIRRQIFVDNSNFNNTSGDLTMNFQNEFSKYDRINLRDAFVRAEAPRSFEDEFGRTAGRYGYMRNRIDFDYTRDITKQLSLVTKFGNSIDDLSREDLTDSFSNNVGVEMNYAHSSATILLYAYDFSRRDFDEGPHATTHSAQVGFRQYITKQLYFDGRTGVNFINSYNGKNDTNPIFSASITNELDKNSVANFSFLKSYSPSAFTRDFFNQWRISGNFGRQLFERLRTSLSGFYGEGKYGLFNIKDKLKGSSIALTYDIKEDIKGNLTYTFSKTDSNSGLRGYTRNAVSLEITAEF